MAVTKSRCPSPFKSLTTREWGLKPAEVPVQVDVADGNGPGCRAGWKTDRGCETPISQPEQDRNRRIEVIRYARAIYDVLVDQAPLLCVTQPTSLQFLEIAPADARLEELASALRDESDAQIRLDTAIRERQQEPSPHDVILLDCPPNLGLATRNALASADGVLIPLEADKFSVEGLKRLLDVIEKMRKFNRRLVVEGVLISLYNGRRAIEQTFEQALQAYPGVRVLDVRIKDSAKYREAISGRQPITHYKPGSEYAAAFEQLARTLFQKAPRGQKLTQGASLAYAKHN